MSLGDGFALVQTWPGGAARARHTFATLAMSSARNPVWVSKQLGHSDPAFTLRVYAHAMRDEESDLSFAEFGGSKWLYPALGISGDESELSNPLKRLARREGLLVRLRRPAVRVASRLALASSLRLRRKASAAGPVPPTLRFEEESDPEEEP